MSRHGSVLASTTSGLPFCHDSPRSSQGLRVVAVNLVNVHPKGRQPGGQRLDVHDRRHQPVALLGVHVDIDTQVVDLAVRQIGEGFPGLALLKLAVRHEDPHPARVAAQLASQGDAAGLLIACPSDPAVTS